MTDRSEQTVSTQIKLLLEEQVIRVYTVSHSVCTFWTHYSTIKPLCSNFRVITAIFSDVQIFRSFTVDHFDSIFGIIGNTFSFHRFCKPSSVAASAASPLFVLRLNVPVNNFSVMLGWSHRFLGN